MRKERKILRFVPQKLRKSFANGNPKTNKQTPKQSKYRLGREEKLDWSESQKCWFRGEVRREDS